MHSLPRRLGASGATTMRGPQAALAINGILVLLYAPLLWLATPVRDIDQAP